MHRYILRTVMWLQCRVLGERLHGAQWTGMEASPQKNQFFGCSFRGQCRALLHQVGVWGCGGVGVWGCGGVGVCGCVAIMSTGRRVQRLGENGCGA